MNLRSRFTGAMLLVWLLSPNLCAQEPDANTEASAPSSETSSSSKSSEAPLYPSRDIRDKTLLAKVLDDEAQWLETEHGKVLALYRPTEAKVTRGVLILFHAAENPQLWPPMLENLRANLPRYGWETLALSLPQKYPAAIPARPSSSSASASSASADATAPETTEPAATDPATADDSAASSAESASASSAASSSVPRDVLIETYINAAFTFLEEKGQLNRVILTDNSSVFQVLEKLIPQVQENKRDKDTLDGPLQALVITNLQQQEPISKSELEAIFGAEKLPVLDIFFTPDNPEQTEARDLHRAVAMRKKLDSYQQLLLDSQPKLIEQDHQSFLLGRVRGFMQQKADGSETNSSASGKNNEANTKN
ncbi:MAG: DUF3530 family protein [Cellvibrio sp.]|uniref:DUF3530 family protein n=1 Tax=Cellvibrio sp. TaxID=1965322 RepID=UPI0031A1746B